MNDYIIHPFSMRSLHDTSLIENNFGKTLEEGLCIIYGTTITTEWTLKGTTTGKKLYQYILSFRVMEILLLLFV